MKQVLRDPPLLTIVISFVVSRLMYALAGVRFDMRPLYAFDQILDPVLLRDDLLRSLWYLHSQPPGFNFFLGSVLKAFPGYETTVFHAGMMLMGLVAAISLHRLMVRLGVGRWLSAALTIIFFIGPSVVLIENQIFYDYPLMVLAPISGLFLHRFLTGHRGADGVIFFSTLALNALMRSLYHPLLLVVVVVVVALSARERWRQVLYVAAIPVLAVALLFVKNAIVFGGFFSSSWLGSTIYTSTTQRLPNETRRELVARGLLTRAALIEDPFSSRDVFERIGYRFPGPTGIPALDQVVKSTGEPNNNNIAFITISQDCMRDAMYVIRTYPNIYFGAIVRGLVLYSAPQSRVWSMQQNRERVRTFDRIYNLLFYGQVVYDPAYSKSTAGTSASVLRNLLSSGLFLLVFLPILTLLALIRLVRDLRRRRISTPDSSTIAYILISILFVTAVGNLISSAENSRYRFGVDPYFVTLAGLAIQRIRTRTTRTARTTRTSNSGLDGWQQRP